MNISRYHVASASGTVPKHDSSCAAWPRANSQPERALCRTTLLAENQRMVGGSGTCRGTWRPYT